MARQALGKGLSALIPTQLENLEQPAGQAAAASGGVAYVELAKIRPNRSQPRKTFADADLKSLADSIAVQGLLQPVLLVRDGEGYELIAGERRFRAVQSLGRISIPALV